MTTRFKTSLAATVAVLTLAAGTPLIMGAAIAAEQDQPQQRQGRGPGGPGGPGMRGPGGPGMRGPGGPMGFGLPLRELDLSDDQKTQLKSIMDSHRDEFRAA